MSNKNNKPYKKSFFISGASSGLGKEFSLAVADIAKNMIIVGRGRKKLDYVKKKILQINPEINILKIISDLSTEKGLNKIITTFNKQKKIKFIDVLVNSAANFDVKKIEKVTYRNLKDDFHINVFTPFILSKFFGLKMRRKKQGIIFNIGSSSSYESAKETSVYSSTKHALLGMSRAFHKEWRSSGVRSILIAPGSMKTRMGKKVKNQKYSTFIEPKNLADFLISLILQNENMIINEVSIIRANYK